MAARQWHGEEFQNQIAKALRLQTTKYTDKWDGFDGQLPYSIKSKGETNAVPLSDLGRIIEIDEEFALIVGCHRKKVLYEGHILFVNPDIWKTYLPPDAAYLHKHMKEELRSISNSYEDDPLWKETMKRWQKAWKKEKPVITLNPKRDHKDQKRLQASIANGVFVKKVIPDHMQTGSYLHETF